MNIELKEITIRELVEGYRDSNEEGVVGYGGKLNIRPKYQREFVYKDKQRDAVITTIIRTFIQIPLNIPAAILLRKIHSLTVRQYKRSCL